MFIFFITAGRLSLFFFLRFLLAKMKGCVMSIDREKFSLSSILSRNEAAEFLGVKPQTLACWQSTKRYSLPVIKVGRLAKYRLSDLEEFLDRQTVKVPEAE